MPAKTKGGNKSRRSGGATRAKTVTGSTRADTLFPVGRLNRFIKRGRYSERTSSTAGAFMAAVLEYITAEILELAGDLTHQSNFKTIKPKHINLGIRTDAELFKLFHLVQISEGGQPLNLPAQAEKKGKAKN
jgi:histone H2A